MLDNVIIEQIKQRELERGRRAEVVLEIPSYRAPRKSAEELAEEEREGGVLTFDIL